MNEQRFGDLARAAAGRGSRRSVLSTLAALGWLRAAPREAEAEDHAKRRCNRASERSVKRAIRRASRKYNQSYKSMLCVAKCESSLNNCAVNRDGPYYGLFQFLKSTFDGTPYGDKNIFDPEANALATAWKWKRNQQNEWACCDRRYGCNCKR